MIPGLRIRRGFSGLWTGLLACLFFSCTLYAAKQAKPAVKPGFQAPSAAVGLSLKLAQARSCLARAKTAQTAGNMAEAERLWMQARFLDPSLRRPAWLDQKPEGIKLADGISPVEALLKEAASLAYQDAAPLLEDWLRRFPEDARVRAYYLERAKAAQDTAQTRRHQSLLQPEPSKSSTPWWKYLVAVLFGGLLIREAIIFTREWRNERS